MKRVILPLLGKERGLGGFSCGFRFAWQLKPLHSKTFSPFFIFGNLWFLEWTTWFGLSGLFGPRDDLEAHWVLLMPCIFIFMRKNNIFPQRNHVILSVAKIIQEIAKNVINKFGFLYEASLSINNQPLL